MASPRGNSYDRRARKGDVEGDTGAGGRGIDGQKDCRFIQENMDWNAVKSMYGRGWTVDKKTFGSESFDCDYVESAPSNSEVQRNARKGRDPIIGKGNHQAPQQTGHRGSSKRRFSGAFG
jgi:hypothetical protein